MICRTRRIRRVVESVVVSPRRRCVISSPWLRRLPSPPAPPRPASATGSTSRCTSSASRDSDRIPSSSPSFSFPVVVALVAARSTSSRIADFTSTSSANIRIASFSARSNFGAESVSNTGSSTRSRRASSSAAAASAVSASFCGGGGGGGGGDDGGGAGVAVRGVARRAETRDGGREALASFVQHARLELVGGREGSRGQWRHPRGLARLGSADEGGETSRTSGRAERCSGSGCDGPWSRRSAALASSVRISAS